MYTLEFGSLRENAPISQKRTDLVGPSDRRCAEYEITRGERLGTRDLGLGSRGWRWGLAQPRTINLIPNSEFRTRVPIPESRIPSPESRVPIILYATIC